MRGPRRPPRGHRLLPHRRGRPRRHRDRSSSSTSTPTTGATGIGADLHAACVEQWRADGERTATLDVHVDNERAQAFYARQGWVRDGEPVGGASHRDVTLRCAVRARGMNQGRLNVHAVSGGRLRTRTTWREPKTCASRSGATSPAPGATWARPASRRRSTPSRTATRSRWCTVPSSSTRAAPRATSSPCSRCSTKKYGMSEAQAQAGEENLGTQAAAEGLEYRTRDRDHGNTFDMHRLLHFAKEQGRQDELIGAPLPGELRRGAVRLRRRRAARGAGRRRRARRGRGPRGARRPGRVRRRRPRRRARGRRAGRERRARSSSSTASTASPAPSPPRSSPRR